MVHPTRLAACWLAVLLVAACASTPTAATPSEDARSMPDAVGEPFATSDTAVSDVPSADAPMSDAGSRADAPDAFYEDEANEADAAPEDTARGDTSLEDTAPDTQDAVSEPASYGYLALGDSYTIGESVAVEERWPVQLAEALREEGLRIAEDAPEVIARTGWTTANLLAAMDDAELADSYQMVSLLIGVNNQFQRRSIDDYRVELGQLLDRAIALVGDDPSRVLVLSIPDWGATPFGQRSDPSRIGDEIDRFNLVKREECTARGVRYVDITPISREAVQRPEYVAGDDLHPSGLMYTAFVEAAVPDARAIFTTDGE